MEHVINPRLAQNRSGYWEIRFTERTRAGHRSRSVSTRHTSRAAAAAFMKGWLDGERQAATLAGEPALSDLIRDYRAAKPGGDTQGRCLDRLDRLLGSLPPSALTPSEMANYAAARGVQDATLRRELNVLVSVLNYAKRHRTIRPESAPHIDLPPPGQPRDLWLDYEQEAEFLALAYGRSVGRRRLARITRFVAIGLDTGARRQAIERLTWDRVDLSAGLIDFRKPGERQTNKRKGVVPIATRLAPVLERAYREKTSPFVVDPGAIRKTWETFVAGTPYPWVTPHVMRHTCATLMMKAGVPTWEVARVLGNSVEMVDKVYGHHAPNWLRGAVDRNA